MAVFGFGLCSPCRSAFFVQRVACVCVGLRSARYLGGEGGLTYGRKIFLASAQFFSGGLAIFVDSFSAATDCSGFYIFVRGEYFRVRQKMEKKGEIARESMSVFVA